MTTIRLCVARVSARALVCSGLFLALAALSAPSAAGPPVAAPPTAAAPSADAPVPDAPAALAPAQSPAPATDDASPEIIAPAAEDTPTVPVTPSIPATPATPVQAVAADGPGLLAEAPPRPALVIAGGRVVTNTDQGVLETGDVLIAGGRILSVGSGASAPGARRIDAAGRWVTPGLFAPWTRLGLVEVSAEDDANDQSARGSDLGVALDVADAYNPRSILIPVTRIEGVTRAAVAPVAGQGLFGGHGALATLGEGATGGLFRERAFLHLRLDDAGVSGAGGSRSAAWATLRAALDDARGYPLRYMQHVEGEVLRRSDAEALRRALDERALVLVEVNRAADIARLIAFAAETPDLRFAVVGGAEAHLLADDLAAAGIPVVIDPAANLPASFESLGQSLDAAKILIDAGVLVAFAPLTANGGEAFNARLAPQHAGLAVAHGVAWDDAFAAITLNPAILFGVGAEVGRLAPGAVADVVIWDGDPLEVMSAPIAVVIDGVEVDLRSRQTELAARYARLSQAGGRPVAYPAPQP